MNIKNISTVTMIGSLSAIFVACVYVIRRKISEAHDEGWFGGYAEAKKDYDKELRLQRSHYEKIISEINESSEPV